MTRLHHVKKARKDYQQAGIKRGEPYFWWKFKIGGRGGAVRRSKTRPRPSQLTQSDFCSRLLSAQEGVEDASARVGDTDGLIAALEDARSTVEELRDECEEKICNLSDRFPNGCPSLELLEERRDACERIAQELDDAVEKVREGESGEVDWTA